MDLDTCFSLQQAQEMDEEDWEDQRQLTGTACAVILGGAEESRKLRIERRKPNRNDRAFITTMGFDVVTFHAIIDAGFGHSWCTTPIPRGDVSALGKPRLGARSLDEAGALGLVLHYLNSTMRETSLQQIFALIPTTVSRYIRFGLTLLLDVLRTMPDAAIEWPRKDNDFRAYNKLIVERHPLLTGAFASIDGLNLAVQTAEDDEIENATYNGWLCEHFISSVLVYSPKERSLLQN
ncbi:hypothetical protein C8R44DRAFT_873466 [Mycena epipterygia]|nr:hypothetical protein C8R44DRAFT_873466 [Mycena epipterygia]